MFEPDHLQAWTNGKWQGPRRNLKIRGFCHDSRLVQKGDMFVALKTEQRDGHDFVRQAAKKGAVAALVGRPVDEAAIPQLVVSDPLVALQSIAHEHRTLFTGPVVGITGSCGKTSTKDLLVTLLGGDDAILGTEANLNNLLGVPLTLTRLDPARHRAAVVEAGMNEPGEMARLGWMIEPDVAIITMVGLAHLEGLGTIGNIAIEKSALGRAVRRGGYVVYSHSCNTYACFRKLPENRRVLVNETDEDDFDLEPEVAIPYRTETDSRGGSRMLLWRESSAADSYLLPDNLSPGMISNIALAITVAQTLGVKSKAIAQRLLTWKPSSNRGEITRRGNKQFYVDCYNANPSSMQDTLVAFQSAFEESQSRLYVLGSMRELGVDADRLHQETGRHFKLRSQDRAVIVGEHARAFKKGIVEAGANQNQIRVLEHVEQARDQVNDFAGAVLLKGSRAYKLESLLKKPSGSKRKEGVKC